MARLLPPVQKQLLLVGALGVQRGHHLSLDLISVHRGHKYGDTPSL